jgi:hypothetical protein
MYSAKVILTMAALTLTFALSMGAWNKWEQYLIVPVPILLAVSVTLLSYSTVYTAIVGAVFAVILILDVHRSSRLREVMVEFQPKLILRLSGRGILLVFSILGGLLVILHSAKIEQRLNIGEKISEWVEQPIKNMVSNQLETQVREETFYLQGEQEVDLSNVNPTLRPILESMDLQKLLSEDVNTDELVQEADFGSAIEKGINDALAPFQNFIQPIMAVLVFALYQFYAAIAYMIFMVTVNPLVSLGVKVGLFKKEEIQVTKEIVRF